MRLACSKQKHAHPTIAPCDKSNGDQRRGRTSWDWRIREGLREETMMIYMSRRV